MSLPYIDTDVLIRYITGDDAAKQASAAALLTQVEQGQLSVAAPDTVIADAVHVLSSPRLYHKDRATIATLLIPLVRLSKFKVKNKRIVLRALALYGLVNLDFGDVMIVAAMQLDKSASLYSYDRGFDRIAGLTRQEP